MLEHNLEDMNVTFLDSMVKDSATCIVLLEWAGSFLQQVANHFLVAPASRIY